jgi:hypothetical protein
MAQIALNKPSGGQMILAPEDGTSSETVTIPRGGIGRVLQVQHTNYGARWQTSSTNMIATPISVSITPSSVNSKILVTTSIVGGSGGGSMSFVWQVRRDSSVIVAPQTSQTPSNRNVGFMVYQNGDNNVTRTNSFTCQDTPATTSTVTYTVYAQAQDGAVVTLGGSNSNADNASYGHVGACTITVMEVAA